MILQTKLLAGGNRTSLFFCGYRHQRQDQIGERNRSARNPLLATECNHWLLPAAAQRFVELHQRDQNVPLGLGKLLFGGQSLALGIEYF